MKTAIKKVVSKADLKTFIRFADQLYKDNPYYVPPLHSGEIATLSDKNPAFEYCEASYWLAVRDDRVVGRIAGIINAKYNEKVNKKTARFGWLDFVEDGEVLSVLFTTFENWARNKGAEVLQGPMGFISFDASGVLVEGFEELPTSFGHYNHPYYDRMIKSLGYEKEIDWIEFEVKMPVEIPERFSKTSELVRKRYGVRNADVRSKKEVAQYGDELFRVLNVCYNDLYGFNPLTQKQIDSLKKEFLGFINTDFISIVLNDEDQLVGFGIAMPSLSKALQKSRGKLFPFGYLRVFKALKNNDTIDLLLLGILPEYRSKGIHALIFEKMGKAFLKHGIKLLETTRELEDNNNVTQLWSKLEHRQHKRARCYSKKLH
jgi:GNAT superfamily N-acetyltransferase